MNDKQTLLAVKEQVEEKMGPSWEAGIDGFHGDLHIKLKNESLGMKDLSKPEYWDRVNKSMADINPLMYCGIQNDYYVVKFRQA